MHGDSWGARYPCGSSSPVGTSQVAGGLEGLTPSEEAQNGEAPSCVSGS